MGEYPLLLVTRSSMSMPAVALSFVDVAPWRLQLAPPLAAPALALLVSPASSLAASRWSGGASRSGLPIAKTCQSSSIICYVILYVLYVGSFWCRHHVDRRFLLYTISESTVKTPNKEQVRDQLNWLWILQRPHDRCYVMKPSVS